MPDWVFDEIVLFGLPVQNWMLLLAVALAGYGLVLAVLRRGREGH